MWSRQELLIELEKMQQSCSSIVVSIGHTDKDNMVKKDSVIIKKCPPSVIRHLIEKGYFISITEQGAMVYKV